MTTKTTSTKTSSDYIKIAKAYVRRAIQNPNCVVHVNRQSEWEKKIVFKHIKEYLKINKIGGFKVNEAREYLIYND